MTLPPSVEALRSVRRKLAAGWQVWVTPSGREIWAHTWQRGQKMRTREITPHERTMLEYVLPRNRVVRA